MRKLNATAIAAVSALSLATAGVASAASGGNANAGDVWLDNVGQPSGPGHEHDPHLACQDINLWGSGLADGSGTFVIDGWAPSGSQEQDYSANWSYTGPGSQVTAMIDVKQLVAQAAANGDAPINGQGYHFKLQFSQDPQKHKTFWVNCPAPTSPGGTPPPNGGTPPPNGGTPPPDGGTPPPDGGTPPPNGGTAAPNGGTTTKGAVNGVTHSRKHKHARKHKKHLLKPKRHHRAHARRITRHVDAVAVFTG